MTDLTVSDIAIAPPEVVRHATRDLAAALAATPVFKAYAQAATAFQQDAEAQAAVRAYQLKQQSMQMMLMLNAVSAEERAELNRLYQAFAARPSVLAYVQAEAELRAVCQAVADRLSQQIGFDFVSACGSGCC